MKRRTYSGSSFRDPAGRIFFKNGIIYRAVHVSYKRHYDFLHSSGLYGALCKAQLLVKHTEVKKHGFVTQDVYKILRPETIPFISYPYEWCLSQLKDAALATLAIQKMALSHGMILKDASAYNIQFLRGKPVLIDSLSFEIYEEGEAWVAYRQFCEHFLAPLFLMRYAHEDLGKLLITYLDGIPLSVARALLPIKTVVQPLVLIHIHLHALFQRKFAGAHRGGRSSFLPRKNLFALVEDLEHSVGHQTYPVKRTTWSGYYEKHSYSSAAFAAKKKIVETWVARIHAKTALDIGANTGVFSQLCAAHGIEAISIDSDSLVVEKNYLKEKKEGHGLVLPLCVDITNPSPAIGWENKERTSFLERIGVVDVVLALALTHHLRITHNIPFSLIAHLFSRLGVYSIVEFVPKSDSQVQRLLANRKEIYVDYTQEYFERCFHTFFTIEAQRPLPSSNRCLYLMKRKKAL